MEEGVRDRLNSADNQRARLFEAKDDHLTRIIRIEERMAAQKELQDFKQQAQNEMTSFKHELLEKSHEDQTEKVEAHDSWIGKAAFAVSILGIVAYALWDIAKDKIEIVVP